MINKVNLADVNWQPAEHDDFAYQRQSLTQALSSEKLGASVFQVAPGKKAFPLHSHCANEEMVLILEGEGSLRSLQTSLPIKKGDVLSFPCGEQNAHQIVNDSTAPLVYLIFSTQIEPDVMVYPDSNKIGVMAGNAPGAKSSADTIKAFFKSSDAVTYYDDEK